MPDTKLERLRKMLQQVEASSDDLTSSSPFEGLEAMGDGGIPDLGSIEPLPGELEVATESLGLLEQDDLPELDLDSQNVLEAIVMPLHRPVVDIENGKMKIDQLGNKWAHLGITETRSKIESTFNAIGRVEVPHHPRVPYAGTGFVVGNDLNGRGILMTNRHVAEIFSNGVGVKELNFRTGQTAAIDFLREIGGNGTSDTLKVEEVLMIHPYWDMALLQVTGLGEERQPLKLSAADPSNLEEHQVLAVGYPAQDMRNDQNLQNRIFRGVYNVKRMQPGTLRNRQNVRSYDKTVQALTHDCSTLGGNSGSAVLLLPNSANDPIEVVGLHFAGRYLEANYAVPAYDLAADSRVVDTGIEFAGKQPPTDRRYEPYWTNADPVASEHARTPQNSVAPSPSESNIQTVNFNGQTSTWQIPLEISISIGTPQMSATTPSPASIGARSAEGLFGKKSAQQLSFEDSMALFSSTSLAADTFAWQTALSTAVASQLAYYTQAEVDRTAINSWGLDSCKFIDEEDTQCFIASSGDNVLISFRGTKELRDWLSNINLFSKAKSYGRVHRGFHAAFDDVKVQLEEELDQLSPKRIFLTGHSLGGALATVAAAEWSSSYPIKGVYTFGQPAVGKGAFSAFFSQHYADSFYRFVNDDDIVSRVPPTYRHIGKLFHFNAQGDLPPQEESIGGGADSSSSEMMTEAEFDRLRIQLLTEKAEQGSAVTTESVEDPALEGIIPSVSDHNISEYIRRIGEQIS